MKVLITGGRDYGDYASVRDTLEFVHLTLRKIDVVIHGDADGADTHADFWANENGVLAARCPANWDLYKNAAGPIRNRKMLVLEPHLVIAFPGGPGTKNMIEVARKNGFVVWEYTPDFNDLRILWAKEASRLFPDDILLMSL